MLVQTLRFARHPGLRPPVLLGTRALKPRPGLGTASPRIWHGIQHSPDQMILLRTICFFRLVHTDAHIPNHADLLRFSHEMYE